MGPPGRPTPRVPADASGAVGDPPVPTHSGGTPVRRRGSPSPLPRVLAGGDLPAVAAARGRLLAEPAGQLGPACDNPVGVGWADGQGEPVVAAGPVPAVPGAGGRDRRNEPLEELPVLGPLEVAVDDAQMAAAGGQFRRLLGLEDLLQPLRCGDRAESSKLLPDPRLAVAGPLDMLTDRGRLAAGLGAAAVLQQRPWPPAALVAADALLTHGRASWSGVAGRPLAGAGDPGPGQGPPQAVQQGRAAPLRRSGVADPGASSQADPGGNGHLPRRWPPISRESASVGLLAGAAPVCRAAGPLACRDPADGLSV